MSWQSSISCIEVEKQHDMFDLEILTETFWGQPRDMWMEGAVSTNIRQQISWFALSCSVACIHMYGEKETGRYFILISLSWLNGENTATRVLTFKRSCVSVYLFPNPPISHRQHSSRRWQHYSFFHAILGWFKIRTNFLQIMRS